MLEQRHKNTRKPRKHRGSPTTASTMSNLKGNFLTAVSTNIEMENMRGELAKELRTRGSLLQRVITGLNQHEKNREGTDDAFCAAKMDMESNEYEISLCDRRIENLSSTVVALEKQGEKDIEAERVKLLSSLHEKEHYHEAMVVDLLDELEQKHIQHNQVLQQLSVVEASRQRLLDEREVAEKKAVQIAQYYAEQMEESEKEIKVAPCSECIELHQEVDKITQDTEMKSAEQREIISQLNLNLKSSGTD